MILNWAGAQLAQAGRGHIRIFMRKDGSFLKYILLFMLLQLSPLPPSALLHPLGKPCPPLGGPHIVVCVHESRTHVLWLLPSPSYIQSPTPVSGSHVSMPLFLLCLSVSLVH